MPNIALIVCMDAKGYIGKNGHMPWGLKPMDGMWFKIHTLGKPVVMGRKTFESLPKALPGRSNAVLTRRPREATRNVSKDISDFSFFTSVDEVLIEYANEPEIMVMGGAGIYTQFLPLATRIVSTHINKEYGGDTKWPGINLEHWKAVVVENTSDIICHVIWERIK